MYVVKAALLLLAVIGSNATPSAEECQSLAKRLPRKDLHQIYGDWVLVWSVADHNVGFDLIKNLTSSHVEFRLLADNKTIEYIERNSFLNTCTTYFINMMVPPGDAENHTLNCHSIKVLKDGVAQEYNDTGDVDFYESCSDCLLMTYKASRMKFLLSYKKESSHRDVEQHKLAHDDHKKLAECLGFTHEKAYVYDGVSDFCHKKSAPEEKS